MGDVHQGVHSTIPPRVHHPARGLRRSTPGRIRRTREGGHPGPPSLSCTPPCERGRAARGSWPRTVQLVKRLKAPGRPMAGLCEEGRTPSTCLLGVHRPAFPRSASRVTRATRLGAREGRLVVAVHPHWLWARLSGGPEQWSPCGDRHSSVSSEAGAALGLWPRTFRRLPLSSPCQVAERNQFSTESTHPARGQYPSQTAGKPSLRAKRGGPRPMAADLTNLPKRLKRAALGLWPSAFEAHPALGGIPRARARARGLPAPPRTSLRAGRLPGGPVPREARWLSNLSIRSRARTRVICARRA